jgi:hypothetical protein
MNNTVSDASLLFITLEHWQDEEIRDRFLSLLFGHLREIDRYRLTRLYWTDELEARLWTDPQLPPWRMDRDWNLRIVPIIARLFRANRVLIEGCGEIPGCQVEPAMGWNGALQEAGQCVLSLMHYVIGAGEEVLLCLGMENQSVGPGGFEFWVFVETSG